MHLDRRQWLAFVAFATGAGSLAAFSEAQVPSLFRTDDPKALLTAARLLLAQDTIGTFITVDETGQPRARSVLISPPDDNMSLWIGTRPGSRKLAQIAANPKATIYCNDDNAGAYLTLMGTARAISDAAVIAAKNPYRGEPLKKYFPNFPVDFTLIGFRPTYLEVTSKTVPSDKATWQPQGLTL